MRRPQVTEESIKIAISLLASKLRQRLDEKGYGSFSSSHEILGVITEEYDELIDEVHDNNLNGVEAELLDIAVASVFSVACITENTLDW